MDADSAEDTLHDFLYHKFLDDTVSENLAQKFLKRRAREIANRPDGPFTSFRSYLFRALSNYMNDTLKARTREPHLGSKNDLGEHVEDEAAMDEDQFSAAWAEDLLNKSIEKVRAECLAGGQRHIWDVFEARILDPARLDTEPPDFDCLARLFKFKDAKQASNLIQTAIRKFKRVLNGLVSDYLPTDGDTLESAIEEELSELQRVSGKLDRGLVLQSLSQSHDEPARHSTNAGSLFVLSENIDSIWNQEDDVAEIWRYVLKAEVASLVHDWRSKQDDQDGEPNPSSPGKRKGVTVEDVWTDARPPLALLKLIKQQAKESALSSHTRGNGLPTPINVVLYTTAIAVASQRLDVRITKDKDEIIANRLTKILQYRWLDPTTRNVLNGWYEKVACENQRPPHVSFSGDPRKFG